MMKRKTPKAATPATLPTWQQTMAVGLVSAELALHALTRSSFEDEDWAALDWDCDSAIELALEAVQRIRQQTYKNPGDFERAWYQVAGVVSLAAKGFSRSDGVYARTLEGLRNLMQIVPELVEQSENYDADRELKQ